MKYVLLVMLAACGGSSTSADSGLSPITCDQSGGMASGVLTVGTAEHPFGPEAHVIWLPQPSAGVRGSIRIVDQTTTAITLNAIDCGAFPTSCAPARGTYTDIHEDVIDAAWATTNITPESSLVVIDAAPPDDPCWAGRFDIRFSGADVPIAGEVSGWWANH
jgi:hypothetical protein